MAAVAQAAAQQVLKIARRAPTGDIDSWFEQVIGEILELIATAFEVLRRMTAAFLQEHAAIEGHAVEPTMAQFELDQAMTALHVTGPVAFKQHMTISGDEVASKKVMADRMAGSAQRLMMEGERRTVEQTVDNSDEIVGWRRVSDGDPCAWCAMLISRGAVYKTKASATRVVGRGGRARNRGDEGRAIGQSYHDRDGCTAVPVYDFEEEPAEVDELYDQWQSVTAGKSGNVALRAWRRYWDEQQAGGDGGVQS